MNISDLPVTATLPGLTRTATQWEWLRKPINDFREPQAGHPASAARGCIVIAVAVGWIITLVTRQWVWLSLLIPLTVAIMLIPTKRPAETDTITVEEQLTPEVIRRTDFTEVNSLTLADRSVAAMLALSNTSAVGELHPQQVRAMMARALSTHLKDLLALETGQALAYMADSGHYLEAKTRRLEELAHIASRRAPDHISLPAISDDMSLQQFIELTDTTFNLD